MGVAMAWMTVKNLRLVLAVVLLLGIDFSANNSLSASSIDQSEVNIQTEGIKNWVSTLGEHRKESYRGSLKEIKKRRFLRVLAIKNSSDYFVVRGYQRGLQYDRIRYFVKHLNKKYGFKKGDRQIKFEVIPVSHGQALAYLKRGFGDVLATSLPQLPNETKTTFRSTRPLEWSVTKTPLVWLTHKYSWKLRRELNRFIPRVREGSRLGNYFIRKNQGLYKAFLNSDKASVISEYDTLFKEYGKLYNLDWRLLAALAFQESRFEQDVVNRWRATGIMQIKPFVAAEPYVRVSGIAGPNNAKNNIHAGTKYLHWLYTTFFNEDQLDETNRARLTLAAYNAGPGRIRQARRKAQRLGLNPDRWFGHVEVALLKMGYQEPVNYVSEINSRFLSYAMYHPGLEGSAGGSE